MKKNKDFVDDVFSEKIVEPITPEESKKRNKRSVNKFKKYVVTNLVVITVLTILLRMVIMNSPIISGSMENTLMTSSSVIASRLSKDFQRNDIIIFDNGEFNMPVVKRIVGMPNDEIEIKDGKAYINGVAEDTSFYDGEIAPTEILSSHPDREKYIVPEGHYFVLGDNRDGSQDSRGFEKPFIPYDKIMAKAILNYSIFQDEGKFYIKVLGH